MADIKASPIAQCIGIMISVPQKPEVINPEARKGLIILCDHASNVVPAQLDGLGLDAKYLQEHIAWDIGAAAITRQMCEMMGIAAVLAPVSRLVIDCNREPDSETLIPPQSDGIAIPGNEGLTAAGIAQRKRDYYTPFHEACEALVKAHLEAGVTPLLVGMHSFTPVMNGSERPWQIGFLWNRDPRLAQAAIGLLERETDLTVGDNLPYSGRDLYYTMQRHGADHGLAQTTIEIRQDLVQTPAMITEWAALLADVLDECMERDDIKGILR